MAPLKETKKMSTTNPKEKKIYKCQIKNWE